MLYQISWLILTKIKGLPFCFSQLDSHRGLTPPPSLSRFSGHADTINSRTPLDEWPAPRRDLCLITNNSHKRHIYSYSLIYCLLFSCPPFFIMFCFLLFICSLFLPFPCSLMGQGSSLLQFYRLISQNMFHFTALRDVTCIRNFLSAGFSTRYSVALCIKTKGNKHSVFMSHLFTSPRGIVFDASLNWSTICACSFFLENHFLAHYAG
jgi:hypothetical protein